MKRILVVDDSRFTLDEISEFLPQDDYDIVGHAKSGEESIMLYEELKPDIVTMDIIMPGMDGIEASEEIIASDPAAAGRIIMISSMCDVDTLDEIHSMGIKYFVAKPIERDALIAAVNDICNEYALS